MSLLHKYKSAYREYHPLLVERPSMTQFVLLSALLHILMVLLLGDTSGQARDGRGWGTTFTALLRPATGLQTSATALPATPHTRKTTSTQPIASTTQSAPQPTTQTTTQTTTLAAAQTAAPAAVTSSAPTVAETAATSANPAALTPLPEIPPIPLMATEIPSSAPTFSVPPLNIAPSVALVATTSFAAVPLAVAPTAAPLSDSGFAVYVPPIIERAKVEIRETPVATIAIPPVKTEITTSNKEFARFAPPVTPIEVKPRPTLAAATAAPAPSPSPAPSVAQVTPIAPTAAHVPPSLTPAPAPLPTIAPIEASARIELPAATTNEFNRYAPPPLPASAANNATSASAASASEANAKLSAADNAPGNRRESAPAQAANAGASSAHTSGVGTAAAPSLIPVFPRITATPGAPLPSLDLDRIRQRAREVSVDGAGNRTLLPFATIAKPEKRDIEKAFDKALKRPDCKEEYRDMGLAAVVPLVRDAIKGDGCKWNP